MPASRGKSGCLLHVSDFVLEGIDKTEDGKMERLSLRVPDFCLQAGEVTAVIGGSGCGKSVLLSLIMGSPAFGIGGRLDFTGFSQFGEAMPKNAFRTVCAANRWRRQLRKSGELFYLPQFFPVAKAQRQKTAAMILQVVQALTMGSRFKTDDLIKRIRSKFEKYRMADVLGKSISELSGGERRRAELIARIVAMEMAGRPGLLVLDEPTTGFDPVNALDFVREVRLAVDELVEAGISVGAVLTTHEMKCLDDVVNDNAKRVIDRVCVVHRNPHENEVNCTVRFDGPTDAVWQKFFSDGVVRTFARDAETLFEKVKSMGEDIAHDKEVV